MPKTASYESTRRFNEKWKEEFNWVTKDLDTNMAKCSLCSCLIANKKTNLIAHEKSNKHKTQVSLQSGARPLQNFVKKSSTDTKVAECEIAVSMVCHASFQAIDHLSEVMVKHGKGSTLENIKLHRTKCSRILTQVIVPALKDQLKKSLKEKPYSVIIDEGSDIGAKKNMAVVAKFFNEEEEKIATEFLGLINVLETTGSSLFESLKTVLQKFDLPIPRMLGYGSDGAANMIGQNNSVWSRVKAESPECVLMQCICHSLDLCAKYSFEQLPQQIGFLLTEVPLWFSKSDQRRDSFLQLFSIMDPNKEKQGTPTPFQKLSQTRWLSRGKILFNIFSNWDELLGYFLCLKTTQETKYKVGVIINMLKDPFNKWYFQFAYAIVCEFETVNGFFQATKADPQEMFQQLDVHYKGLKSRIYDVRGNKLSLSKADYGARIHQELSTYLIKNNYSEAATKVVDDFKKRCFSMIEVAVAEVEKRLPKNKNILLSLVNLHPKKVLSQTDRACFSDLPFPHLREDNLEVIESQYRKIIFVDWKKEETFKGEIPSDTETFWVQIKKHKQGNVQPFYELAVYALTCLILPTSNAVVERVFSSVNNVKTKFRNSLKLETLESITFLRAKLHFQNKCCRDFVVTPEMLARFNSSYMYVNKAETEEEEDNILDFV